MTPVDARFLMKEYHDKLFVNIGTGEEVSIRELAGIVGEVVVTRVLSILTRPARMVRPESDGQLTSSRHGWKHQTGLRKVCRRPIPFSAGGQPHQISLSRG